MLASPKGLIDGEPHKNGVRIKKHGNKETTTLLFTATILATAVAIPSKITIDSVGKRNSGNILK